MHSKVSWTVATWLATIAHAKHMMVMSKAGRDRCAAFHSLLLYPRPNIHRFTVAGSWSQRQFHALSPTAIPASHSSVGEPPLLCSALLVWP